MTQQNYNSFEIDEIIYPAQRAMTLAQDMTHSLMEMRDKVVKTHLPGVDGIANPFFPGTLVSIIGRPQHAKTFMSMYTLHETMSDLQRRDANRNEVCILISAEVSVEVAMLQMLSKQVSNKNISVSQILILKPIRQPRLNNRRSVPLHFFWGSPIKQVIPHINEFV